MPGAIVGDIIGSVHEFAATKTKDFPLLAPRSTFTDDTVLTIAVAEWLLTAGDLVDLLHTYTESYPARGYGGMYRRWASARSREPYHSFWKRVRHAGVPRGFRVRHDRRRVELGGAQCRGDS